MVVFQARIPLAPAIRDQVLRSLRQVIGETRAWPGCLSCRLYVGADERTTLALMEEWADLHSLRNHLRSDSFKVVLSAIDCASDQPEVRFDTISSSTGMEFISACRQVRRSAAHPYSGETKKPGGGD